MCFAHFIQGHQLLCTVLIITATSVIWYLKTKLVPKKLNWYLKTFGLYCQNTRREKKGDSDFHNLKLGCHYICWLHPLENHEVQHFPKSGADTITCVIIMNRFLA